MLQAAKKGSPRGLHESRRADRWMAVMRRTGCCLLSLYVCVFMPGHICVCLRRGSCIQRRCAPVVGGGLPASGWVLREVCCVPARMSSAGGRARDARVQRCGAEGIVSSSYYAESDGQRDGPAWRCSLSFFRSARGPGGNSGGWVVYQAAPVRLVAWVSLVRLSRA
jgi:hypothetical protein